MTGDRPILIEQRIARAREAFALVAKYPLRQWRVLSPEELAAARRELGPAGFHPPPDKVDRRPLTRSELNAARARQTVANDA